MAKLRIGFKLLSVLAIGCSAGLAQAAAPAPAQILHFKPKQKNVNYSTPSDAELAGCKVELAKGSKTANGKMASGWLLKDPQGRVLRRFFDTDGDNQIDVWSYFLNGEECYREVDSNLNGKVDQYRWLGPNGEKWGVDMNEDGIIDAWKVISAEEASQEILSALAANDFNRLQALMLSKSELDALDLPEAEANRLRAKLRTAAATFQTTVGGLKLTEKSKWIHLETSAPECVAADSFGGKSDLVHYRQGTILYGDEKSQDFMQTGELVLIGRAWRVVEGPVPGSAPAAPMAGGNVQISDEIKHLVDQLKVVDDKFKDAKTPAAVAEYNIARGEVLEQIVGALKAKDIKDREEWIKQAADCFSTAAQNGAKNALPKLVEMQERVAKEVPGSSLAAYVAYREMSAEYSLRLTDTPADKMPKLQEDWKDRLAKFVQTYPSAEDTPDAIMQLGMVAEFVGKEAEAKSWYAQLVKDFEKNPMAAKANGCIRRLSAEGQDLELTSQLLTSKAAFDAKSMKGKTCIVYYWASWNGQCVSDFAKLKAVMSSYSGKGVELVCVNLDTTDADANKFLTANPLPATHLHQPGGLDSPPAIAYGIMVLPNLFIVNSEGKIVNRNGQVATLEDELKKLVK